MKKRNIITICSCVMILSISIVLTIALCIKSKKNNSLNDIDKYNLTNPVLIQYTNFDDLLKTIDTETDTYFIYFGKPECQYCQRYLPIVNEIMYDKNIPILYYNAEYVKGTYVNSEGNLCLNEEYKKVVDWVINNSVVDAKENGWIQSLTVTENDKEATFDWLYVPRFFKVENNKITNCFKSTTEAEAFYKTYKEASDENKDAKYKEFKDYVVEEYKKFMNNDANQD